MDCWIFLLQGRVDIALASGTFFLSMFDYFLRATFLETLVLVLMAMSAFVMSSDSEAWGSNSQHLLEMCRACRGVGHSQAFWRDFPYLLRSVPVPDFFLIGDVNQRNKPVSNCPTVVHDEPCPAGQAWSGRSESFDTWVWRHCCWHVIGGSIALYGALMHLPSASSIQGGK